MAIALTTAVIIIALLMIVVYCLRATVDEMETYIEQHIEAKVKVAARLTQLSDNIDDEILRLEIAEMIADLTSTVKEMW